MQCHRISFLASLVGYDFIVRFTSLIKCHIDRSPGLPGSHKKEWTQANTKHSWAKVWQMKYCGWPQHVFCLSYHSHKWPNTVFNMDPNKSIPRKKYSTDIQYQLCWGETTYICGSNGARGPLYFSWCLIVIPKRAPSIFPDTRKYFLPFWPHTSLGEWGANIFHWPLLCFFFSDGSQKNW